MRLSPDAAALRSAIPCCHWVAQRNASTTLANSTSKPSPVVLTMRPRCSLIFGSITAARIDRSRLRVPSSLARLAANSPRHQRRGSQQDDGSDSSFGQPGLTQTFGDRHYDLGRIESQCVSCVVRRCKPRVKFEHSRHRETRFRWPSQKTASRHFDAQCGKISRLVTQREVCPFDSPLVLTLLERR